MKIEASRFEAFPNYEAYIKLHQFHADNRSTSGKDQSQFMVDYTQLNYYRCTRAHKTLMLSDEIENFVNSITEKQNWLIITEFWCGDAAQNIPLFARMAELNKNIHLKLCLRDENLDIMNQYLTSGSMSIPILVIMDEDFNDLMVWGPRPDFLQQIVIDFKNNPSKPKEEFYKDIHAWYAKDKTESQQLDFLQKLKSKSTV
jgi:hypothetical protein